MQGKDDPDKGNHNNGEQEKDEAELAPKWLPRWLFSLIGPLSMIVVIVGGTAAYYAYFYVNRDSVRAQFWVGFMFSFAALVVVAVQVVIYAQQAEFMKEQAKASSQLIELMVINERAYLRIGKWQKPRFENGELLITGKMVNAGKTPAWNVHGASQVSVKTGGFPAVSLEDLWPDQSSAGGAITVNGDLTFDSRPIKVSDDEIKAIEDGAPIFIDGICSYYDSLGGRQFYAYGFTLTVKPSRFIPRYEHHRRIKANN